uniref:Uncharacterized protein n=1 Tax=Oryza punctata TaxID=4537 RepID=A0A0E0LTH7_ORYPU
MADGRMTLDGMIWPVGLEGIRASPTKGGELPQGWAKRKRSCRQRLGRRTSRSASSCSPAVGTHVHAMPSLLAPAPARPEFKCSVSGKSSAPTRISALGSHKMSHWENLPIPLAALILAPAPIAALRPLAKDHEPAMLSTADASSTKLLATVVAEFEVGSIGNPPPDPSTVCMLELVWQPCCKGKKMWDDQEEVHSPLAFKKPCLLIVVNLSEAMSDSTDSAPTR